MEAVNITGGWLIILGNLRLACGQKQEQFKSFKSCSILLQKRPEKRTPNTHWTVQATDPEPSYGNSEISNTRRSLVTFTSGKARTWSSQSHSCQSLQESELLMRFNSNMKTISVIREGKRYHIGVDSAQSMLWDHVEEVANILESTVRAASYWLFITPASRILEVYMRPILEHMDRQLLVCRTLICQEKDHRGTDGWENPRGDSREETEKKSECHFLSFVVQVSTHRTFIFKWLSLLVCHKLSILALE